MNKIDYLKESNRELIASNREMIKLLLKAEKAFKSVFHNKHGLFGGFTPVEIAVHNARAACANAENPPDQRRTP